jgi:hypothetical protein
MLDLCVVKRRLYQHKTHIFHLPSCISKLLSLIHFLFSVVEYVQHVCHITQTDTDKVSKLFMFYFTSRPTDCKIFCRSTLIVVPYMSSFFSEETTKICQSVRITHLYLSRICKRLKDRFYV